MDKWFAECLPCKWRTAHNTEDAAIADAEAHVAAHHSKVSGPQRAEQRIGHVQLRGEDAVGYEFAASAGPEPASGGVVTGTATPDSTPALPPATVAGMLPGESDPTGTQ